MMICYAINVMRFSINKCLNDWMLRDSKCINCRAELDADQLKSSRVYKNIIEKQNEAKHRFFQNDAKEAICKIHNKKSEYFCIDHKVIVCVE